MTFQPPKDGSRWSANQAIGRDHLWLTSEETAVIAKAGTAGMALPASVAMRIARFHLIDNVRGEPSFWNRAHVRRVDMKLKVEDSAKHLFRLEGSTNLATNIGDRGYDCRIQGLLAYDPPTHRFTRMDILAWGESWGEGAYTRGAPAGRFPLVVAFSLAGNTPADRVPPQGARSLSEYLNP